MKRGTLVGLGPGHIVLDGDPALPPQRGTAPPIFDPYQLLRNGCMDQDVTWYGARLRPMRLCVRWGPSCLSRKGGAEPRTNFRPMFIVPTVWMDAAGTWHGSRVGLTLGEFVLDGDPARLPQKGAESPSPIFGPFLLWPNGWMHQDATWYRCSLSLGDFELDGDQVPLPKKGRNPHQIFEFSAHAYCGQTAGWIKMPLGSKVGLSPGDCVLDGDPALLPTTGLEPLAQFSAHFYCGQTARCITMSLGMEVGLSPGDFGLDGDPAPLPKGRRRPGAESPNFRPMAIVAKRLDGSRWHLAWR